MNVTDCGVCDHCSSSVRIYERGGFNGFLYLTDRLYRFCVYMNVEHMINKCIVTNVNKEQHQLKATKKLSSSHRCFIDAKRAALSECMLNCQANGHNRVYVFQS